MRKSYISAFIYLLIGLGFGVFAREYTKVQGFEGYTVLNVLHTHVLILGFMFFLISLILSKLFSVHQIKSFNVWFIVYNIGLVLTIGSMTVRGILQVNGNDMAGLSHMAGMSHSIIGIALIWYMLLLNKAYKQQ